MEDGAEVRASAPLLVEHSPLLGLLTCTVLRQAAERGAAGPSATSASPLGSSGAPPAAAGSAPTAEPAAPGRQASALGPKWVAGQPVVLRVELATRIQAKAMQWAVWGTMLVLVVGSVMLVVERDVLSDSGGQPRDRGYHIAVLAVSCSGLAALLALDALFISRVHQARKHRLIWSPKHVALVVDAAAVLVLVTLQGVFWVAGYGAVVASSCAWPTTSVTAFSTLWQTFFALLLTWLLVAMDGMTICHPRRGAGAVKQSPLDDAKPITSPTCNGLPRGDGTPTPAVSEPQQCAPAASPPPGVPPSPRPAIAHGRGAAAVEAVAKAAASKAAEVAELPAKGVATGTAAAPALAKAAVSTAEEVASGMLDTCQLALDATVPGGLDGTGAWGGAWLAQAAGGSTSSRVMVAASGQELWVDRPWREQLWRHAPKLACFAVLEGLVIFGSAKQARFAEGGAIAMSDSCAAQLGLPASSSDAAGCGNGTAQRWVAVGMALLVLAYFVLYALFQQRAFRDHARLPYQRFRLTNLHIRVQARHTAVLLASIALTALVQRISSTAGSCWSFLEAQLGPLLLQLALFLMAALAALLYMPLGGVGPALIQAWLQEFAWTRAALPAARAHRNAQLLGLAAAGGRGWLERAARQLLRALLPVLGEALAPSDTRALHAAEEALAREPMLCFQTLLELFFVARHAYCWHPRDSTILARSGMFGVQHWETLQEPASDMQALLGWGGPGNPTLLVGFKGTASVANVLEDLELYPTPQLPRRRWRGELVEVHAGFYRAWRRKGFDERLLVRLEEVAAGLRVDEAQLRVFVTGHSLGGGVACLAAYDIRQRWPAAAVHVYTFGCPRVGNAAWAAQYNAAVPDSWMVVNHDDPVPRVPKVFWYRRSGHQVSVCPSGDLLVRPCYWELSLLLNLGFWNRVKGPAVSDHLALSYAASLAAVLKAQFSGAKQLPGGEKGARQLAAATNIGEALGLQHCDLASLEDPGVQPGPAFPQDGEDGQAASGQGGCRCCGLFQVKQVLSRQELEYDDAEPPAIRSGSGGGPRAASAGGGLAGASSIGSGAAGAIMDGLMVERRA